MAECEYASFERGEPQRCIWCDGKPNSGPNAAPKTCPELSAPPTPEVDLFGNVRPSYRHPGTSGRKRNPPGRGYGGKPGAGPQGEKCATCEHYVRRISGASVYRKCALIEWRWTRGAGTDIKASSPACENWTKPQPEKEA